MVIFSSSLFKFLVFLWRKKTLSEQSLSHGNAYYKRTFGLAVARSWQRFRHRAPRWLPPIGEASLLATLARNFRRQIGDSLLADLASARADPVEILENTLPKLIAARSAL